MNKKERKQLEEKITEGIKAILKENKIQISEELAKKIQKHAKALSKKTGKNEKAPSELKTTKKSTTTKIVRKKTLKPAPKPLSSKQANSRKK